MSLSVLDLFTIGIGPSSSHTVGPMRAARHAALAFASSGVLARARTIDVDLFGSLGATGRGHGTDRAVVLGLAGHRPEVVDPDAAVPLLDEVARTGQLTVLGEHPIAFGRANLRFHATEQLPRHPNGMRFTARDGDRAVLATAERYSVGGGFVVDAAGQPITARPHATVPHPFASGAELLAACAATGHSIAEVVAANEAALRPVAETERALDEIAATMRACIEAGLRTDGILPGGLEVPRRAAEMRRRLVERPDEDGLVVLDWLSAYAIAVNEENAAGHRVVTAPTNGAAGIVPAVLEYYRRAVPGADSVGVHTFLLTAGAFGMIVKQLASISGAEVGCQGEVGTACSMAAAGLTAVLGGSPSQVENAAEIAMEHNLGLTCDPVGGLVQVPCIERNAVAATKALTAARLALQGDGDHLVSFDRVVATMRAIGEDMHHKYKETSLGGLAVSIVEC